MKQVIWDPNDRCDQLSANVLIHVKKAAQNCIGSLRPNAAQRAKVRSISKRSTTRSKSLEESRASIDKIRTTEPGNTSFAKSAMPCEAASFTCSKVANSTPMSSETKSSFSRVSK